MYLFGLISNEVQSGAGLCILVYIGLNGSRFCMLGYISVYRLFGAHALMESSEKKFKYILTTSSYCHSCQKFDVQF